jgi:hypothetical protein
MDSKTIIIGGAIALLFITLYLISRRSKRKKEKMFLGILYNLTGNIDSQITRYDIWNNLVIGVDDSTNHVFFIKNIFDDETFLSVKLSEILKCRVNEVSRTVTINGSGIKVIEKVELVFINQDKNKPDSVTEFYNQDSGKLDLSGELQLAEKWCKIANDNITALAEIK